MSANKAAARALPTVPAIIIGRLPRRAPTPASAGARIGPHQFGSCVSMRSTIPGNSSTITSSI
ncbi:Uncharacterised protein [Mycobacterium tuberculosis]|uniref:Uncharacterized protein n=1 Tax=Mycobacterium tuberculosis TaxID=1773 RepID=A0A655ATZ4_MYCTX|nr:Uncharacterised protein [Mycobacterium tuberculosis]CNV91035.1 Uncharacterised protein [Mycobacterium tuberculosis]